jgi:sec-independent protein translocase protein TatB
VFNIGPGEFLVLAIVAVIVLGPDRLPGLARDAARMLRTLRELATGARTQLREELGPEFADLDLSELRELRNLNPRTALQRAILGEEDGTLRSFRDELRDDLRDADPRSLTRDMWSERSEQEKPAGRPVNFDKPPNSSAAGETPAAGTPWDEDAT